MKKLFFLCLSILVGSLCANAATKVAILVDGPIDEADKFIIESRVGNALKTSKFIILERTQEFRSLLTQEEAYQLSGDVPPSEICKLGERWGATYVIGIYVVETRNTMVATAKIMNVRTGRTLTTVSNHRIINNASDLIVFGATLGVNIKREADKIL